ncbi:acyl-CoA synthetase [Halomonas shantousis]
MTRSNDNMNDARQGDADNAALDKRQANYSALSPVAFLKRSAHVFPHKTAVIDGDTTLTYHDFYRRCRQVASALAAQGIGPGDTVSVMAHNGRELLESHYSIPMLGAVLNAVNTRLDASTVGFILEHGESKALLYDTDFEALVEQAISGLDSPPRLIAIERDGGATRDAERLDYEALLEAGDPDFIWQPIEDEWASLSLNYTSGTTGNPKGVVYHHRGAYLAAMSNAMAFDMTAQSVYLWTLPMFHCNGWGFPWAVTAIGGTHVCLRGVDCEEIHRRIEAHRVTHMCGAPIVMNMLLNDLSHMGKTISSPVRFALGGAAPPDTVIAKARQIGFEITHLYGLTETYGPSALCVDQEEWAQLSVAELAKKMARQGVANFAIDDMQVWRVEDDRPVPWDGVTLGEIVIRGNTVMKGYFKNLRKTEEAFRGGWFHTGDLAVTHPDGYVEIKDRSKDIIISGGENISSLEIEEVLYAHPRVMEAAVVACPDEKWGEVPCAFIHVTPDDEDVSEQEIIEFCRSRMARFKVPKKVVIGELPKTATGKIRKNILRERIQ